VLPGDRPRDRAERAVAVPAEHEPVFRHRHAVVAITEVPHENRAGRWDASVPTLGGARSLERILGWSENRSAGRQGLEVAREARLAAEVLRHLPSDRHCHRPLVAQVDLPKSVRDRANQPGSVPRSRVSAEGVAIDLAQLARPHLLDAGDTGGQGRVNDDGWCWSGGHGAGIESSPTFFICRCAAAVIQIVRRCHIRPGAVNREQRARESKPARTRLDPPSGAIQTRLMREPERAPESAKMPSAGQDRCSGTPDQ
jgi:hypothetical protein